MKKIYEDVLDDIEEIRGNDAGEDDSPEFTDEFDGKQTTVGCIYVPVIEDVADPAGAVRTICWLVCEIFSIYCEVGPFRVKGFSDSEQHFDPFIQFALKFRPGMTFKKALRFLLLFDVLGKAIGREFGHLRGQESRISCYKYRTASGNAAMEITDFNNEGRNASSLILSSSVYLNLKVKKICMSICGYPYMPLDPEADSKYQEQIRKFDEALESVRKSISLKGSRNIQ